MCVMIYFFTFYLMRKLDIDFVSILQNIDPKNIDYSIESEIYNIGHHFFLVCVLVVFESSLEARHILLSILLISINTALLS